MLCYPYMYAKQESSDVQLEPIIPYPVDLIRSFLLFIQTINECIRPPNIYPVINILSSNIYQTFQVHRLNVPTTQANSFLPQTSTARGYLTRLVLCLALVRPAYLQFRFPLYYPLSPCLSMHRAGVEAIKVRCLNLLLGIYLEAVYARC